MLKNKINLSAVAGVVMLAAVFAGCDGGEGAQRPTRRNVILTQPVSLSANRSTTYSGVIEDEAAVTASFMADGRIARILVKEGDRVTKGQLIATIEDTDYSIGVSQLEAQFEQMTKEKERMDAMMAKHNIAPNDYEKFNAGYEQLRLQLEGVRRKRDYTRLYAPVSGYVAVKYMSDGELVGAGNPVVKIIDDSQLVVSVDLPVSVYMNRAEIKSVSGRVPAIESGIPLGVVSFTPDVDNTMLYRMKLAVPAKYSRELSAGMNIAVTIVTAGDDTAGDLLVPSRSIVDDKGATFVWVYNPADSTIGKQTVRVIGEPVGRLSVVSGLSDTVSVVETGVRQLYDGEKVNVLRRREIGM